MTNQENINSFLYDYCAAFRPGNIPAVAKFYRPPVTMIFANQVSILDDEGKIIRTLQSIMDTLTNKDFSHSQVDSCNIHQLTDKTALLSATFSRLKTDGTLLEKLGATYTVIDDGDGYKIAALIAHGVETVIGN
ncbi:MAG: hypothetical protein DRR06_13415 [Gammaproteobacteria bacterium]|nr:MAG: hypothetical protein DRR06_13415 [Gammaproteobacteria bacterium]RLA49082.1 MAG: hypothetical protein DRR42_16005 [Gammaproteobacteria bacterium]